MEIEEQQFYLVDESKNKVNVFHFDLKFLETIHPLLKGRIVEFDLTKNKSQDTFSKLFFFIKNYSLQWKGLALNFRYQNKNFPQKSFKELNEAIMNMEDLEVLSLSFGGYLVSEFYAENKSESHYEWDKSTNGLKKQYDNYKDLLETFSKIVFLSPNLKIFCLDFQGLGQDCIFMLRQLIGINQSLVQCSKLEEIILNFNHCQMYDDSKGQLSQYLNSFLFLKDAKLLKKFIFNIADWDLSQKNFEILGKIFGEYLTHEKEQFEEFQFDHSSEQEIDHQNQTEIKHLNGGFKKLLELNRATLKKFYISLVQYICENQEIEVFMSIFNAIANCEILEKLSIRIQSWNCTSILLEERFYKQLDLLKNLRRLKLFHLSTFNTQLREMSPYYKYAQAIIDILGKKSLMNQKLIPQQRQIQSLLSQYYRSDILQHMHGLINPKDIENSNPKFSLTQFN